MQCSPPVNTSQNGAATILIRLILHHRIVSLVALYLVHSDETVFFILVVPESYSVPT